MQLVSDLASGASLASGPLLPEPPGAVLLVHPRAREVAMRRRIPDARHVRVECAESAAEVFTLDPEWSPAVVAISDQLGRSVLVAVAEYARHRWPGAGIVVIGPHPHALDSGLYDLWMDDLRFDDFGESVRLPEAMERYLGLPA